MNRLFRGKTVLALAMVVVALLGSASAASADPIVYNLTSNHCSEPDPCGAPGTIFGTVSLAQNGTTVDVTVDLNDSYVYAKTGAADFLAFKFNAVGVVVGDITVNQTWAGQTLAPAAGDFHGDGTADFGFGINCTTCGNGISLISTNIVFHVANATIADLTVPNSLPTIFVADIGNPANGATGPIDAGTPNIPTPEPTSLLLLGTGMLGSAKVFGKRRKGQQ